VVLAAGVDCGSGVGSGEAPAGGVDTAIRAKVRSRLRISLRIFGDAVPYRMLEPSTLVTLLALLDLLSTFLGESPSWDMSGETYRAPVLPCRAGIEMKSFRGKGDLVKLDAVLELGGYFSGCVMMAIWRRFIFVGMRSERMRVCGEARITWLSFYKTSHSAEERGMGHPSRRFATRTKFRYCKTSHPSEERRMGRPALFVAAEIAWNFSRCALTARPGLRRLGIGSGRGQRRRDGLL
jgi:hypothetical protein